jgi:hypothetical protein
VLKHLVIIGIVFVLALGVASLYTNQLDAFMEFLKLCVSSGKVVWVWIIDKGIPIFVSAIQKVLAIIQSYGG